MDTADDPLTDKDHQPLEAPSCWTKERRDEMGFLTDRRDAVSRSRGEWPVLKALPTHIPRGNQGGRLLNWPAAPAIGNPSPLPSGLGLKDASEELN